jgi:hypothetical protein
MIYSNKLSLNCFFSKLSQSYYYFYFFIMILWAARAVPITGSMIFFTGNLISFSIPILLTLLLLIKYPITFINKKLGITLGIISIWFFAQYIKYNNLNVSLTFYLYYGIIIAYIHVKIYGKNLIYLYEDIVSHLSAIAIIGWLIQIILPQFIHKLMIFPSNTGTISGSCLLYSEGLDYKTAFIFFRNAGFSWEPGMFASIIIIALLFNIVINHYKIKNNTKFYTLIIALITTQSTTGYGTFLLLGSIIFLINYRSRYKFILLLIIIPLTINIYKLPIMGDKIESLWVSNINETKDKLETTQEYHQEMRALTRFEALAMEIYNIKNDPILGYGRDNTNSFIERNLKLSVGLPNGILKIFAKYGLVLGLLFYGCLYSSSRWMSKELGYHNPILFFIAYCMISISYSFIETPIFLALTLLSLFSAPSKRPFRLITTPLKI